MRWMIRKSKKAKTGRKTAAKRARRRMPVPRWLVLGTRITLVASVLAFTIGGPIWLWQSGWVDRTVQTVWETAMIRSMKLGLTVQDVHLEGRRYTKREEIVKAIAVRRGAPILSVDLTAARHRLEALPWVQAANVERRLPSMIRISIRERRPMALWQRKGRFVLVDDSGEKITDRNLGQFRNLVILIGKDAPLNAPTLFAMIGSEPDLAQRVTAATWIGKRRWNLELRGGIKIQLPEREPHRAWHRLALLDERHQLLARDIKTIDMRLPDRLIVKPGALGAQAKRLKGQST